MIFDSRVVLLIREDLLVWQKLNVAAFLSTGIAGAVPRTLGEPYEDAAGRRYAAMLRQPILVFAATTTALIKARGIGLDRDLTMAAYVESMFSTGHDGANREAFRAEPVETPNLVGLALFGPKKDVDRATKGLKLHA